MSSLERKEPFGLTLGTLADVMVSVLSVIRVPLPTPFPYHDPLKSVLLTNSGLVLEADFYLTGDKFLNQLGKYLIV